MGKGQFEEAMNDISKYVKHNAPKILMGAGIGTGIATTVLSVWATPKALQLINDKKREEHTEKLTVIQVIRTAGVCYVPAMLTGATSIACLLLSSKASDHQMSALMTAYALSETTLRDYKSKVLEIVGAKKEEAVHDAIAKDQIAQNPISKSPVFITGRGDSLFYDPITKTYFYSDIEKIRQGINVLNNRLIHEGFLTLNDFYDEIGLEPWVWGDKVGWDANKGLIDIIFSAQLAENGTPCVVIDFRIGPYWEFDK